MCDGGRDLEGMELVEYCDNLFFDAYEVGRCKIDRREGGDVISGGNDGWFGFEDGEDTGDEEVAGETVSIVGDMTAAILVSRLVGRFCNRREKSVSTDVVSFDDDQLAEACQQALGIAPGANARTRVVVEHSKPLGDSSNRCASRSTAVEPLISGDWVAAIVRIR